MTSLAVPFTKRIQSLFSLIDSENDQESTNSMPFLSMTLPKPGGRFSGGLVPFIGEVVLGTVVVARLDSTLILPAAQRRLRDDNVDRTRGGGGSWYDLKGHADLMLYSPDFDSCEVRVVVDDEVASVIPVAAPASADISGTSDPTAAVPIHTTVVPHYEQNIRCSEHPDEPKEQAAAAEPRTLNDDQYD